MSEQWAVRGRAKSEEEKGQKNRMTKEPLGLHVLWTETVIKRRHAKLSVKLETSEAQLTAESLIVRTSLHSHSEEKRSRGETQVETHFTA